MSNALAAAVASHYQPVDYPATAAQLARWEQSRPLAGMRILDCTPLFANTLAKFLPLQAGGAEVFAGIHPQIPSDPATVALLPDLGIGVVDVNDAPQQFDVVLDCAGRHRAAPSTFGYAELTHSGLAQYADCSLPVVVIDVSPLKLLETMFGTGDALMRALDQLVLDHEQVTSRADLTGLPVVIFGAGKVGSGIALNAMNRQLAVTVVDDAAAANFAGAPLIDRNDHEAVRAAIADAGLIVSATGVAHALAPHGAAITASQAIVANMGVDDEFGPQVPPSRVLNNKVPVNFVLAEPTLMRYMDPVFALSNAAAVDLVHETLPNGIQAPAPELEAVIARDLRTCGTNVAELDTIAAIVGRSL